MTHSDMLMAIACKTEVKLTCDCMTGNGFWHDDKFIIAHVIGNYEQLVIVNELDQAFLINPNQLED